MRRFKQPGHEWRERSKQCIAHSALTNSKRPSCFVAGVYPTHLQSGQGAIVTDPDGNKYLDFITGLGCSILGYANAEVNQAIISRLEKGATLSLGTPLEVECAEKIKELFPWTDQVRFLKTGSDACSAAIKIARAKTGQSIILSDGYHGWDDPFMSLTQPAIGVPPDVNMSKLRAEYEDMDLWNVAAVIIEPIVTDWSIERLNWLRKLRADCTRLGVLLIFDEIITGFRWPKFSVSNYYGIEPDILCLGKAIANGLPLSVVAGKKAVMECEDYFISSTFAGETLSLASALKTMTLLQTKHSLNELWIQGEAFLKRFNSFAPDQIRIAGYPTRGAFEGDQYFKALFWQESCRAGLLFGPSWFFNFSHIEHAEIVLSTCADIINRIKTGHVTLNGSMPKIPMAQQIRSKQNE